jgi:hypothetical protein
MKYKGLLRQSRPRQVSAVNDDRPPIQMPLTIKSEVMKAFVERCRHMAKMGHFLLILGHPGDLIESHSLFQYLMCLLRLQRPVVATTGNERLGVLSAEDKDVDALFVPCATQIPPGTQQFMAEGHLNHLGLVLLCYPMHKNMNLESLLRPSLKRRSIGMLQYPEWNLRKDDHVDCVAAAIDIAEKQFDCDMNLSEEDFKSFHEKQWKSVAHMLVAVMDAAKEKTRPIQATDVSIIRL